MTTDNEIVSPEVWQRVSFLFSEALELPAPQRERFLAEACGASATLQVEVRKLLANYACAEGFLEVPALPPDSEPATPTFRVDDLLSDRFKIERLLGAGGMGEVYQAFDSWLGQRNAIKTLRRMYAQDADMARQFRVEVLRSRRITHRNVVRVHELFTHSAPDGSQVPFFTMELIEGETLAQRLSTGHPFTPQEARPLLGQMAEALDAAHSGGVVHRDFKPGNVFLTAGDGGDLRLKVADFGIAGESGHRLEGPDQASESATVSVQAGTPAYMAPEQLGGVASSPAADIYALGLVAYEMLTGKRVYNTDSPLVCMLKKGVAANPEPCNGDASIPSRWASAIHRALRWDPQERFASAGEFVAALDGKTRRRAWWTTAAVAAALFLAVLIPRIGPGTAPRAASIAVLPFASDGNQQVYLGDGIAEGLIRSLGSYPNVRLSSLASAAAYGKKETSSARIAKKLKVDLLVTGSVQQSGHHVRLTARLENGKDGKELWSHPYDCDAEQILSVQHDITQSIASRLSLGKPSPHSSRPPTANAAAYDLYMRGRYLGNMRTRENLNKSLDYCTRAIHLDNRFALAYTEVAESYEMLYEYGWMPQMKAAPKIREALDRALALDPDDAKTEACLGLYNHHIAWKQVEAERAFLRAISLDPNLPEAHHWYAAYLWRDGRLDAGLREAQEARRLDPVTIPTLLELGWVRYGRHEYGEAIEICKQALELNPRYSSAYQLMAESYADLGQIEQALAASLETQRLDTDRAVSLRHRGLVLSRLPGYRDEARRIAADLETLSVERQVGYLARIYGALRDRELMYRWADRAIESHDIGLLEFKVDPALDWARREPRFQDILRKTGF